MNVVNTSKDNIIEGKGYEKGIFKSISQNIILMFAANVSCLKNIISILLDKIKEVSTNEVILDLFEDLIKKLNNCVVLSREKIYNMFNKK